MSTKYRTHQVHTTQFWKLTMDLCIEDEVVLVNVLIMMANSCKTSRISWKRVIPAFTANFPPSKLSYWLPRYGQKRERKKCGR